jgi:SpoVK/Ycf46/Vps4 family AAA+-type ATPase
VTSSISLSDPPTRRLDDSVWSDAVWTSLKPLLTSDGSGSAADPAVSTVLISGPRNAGKSHLATALAGELGYPVCRVSSVTDGDADPAALPDAFVESVASNRPCTVIYDTFLTLERASVDKPLVDAVTRRIHTLRAMDDVVVIATARGLAGLPERLKHTGVFEILCPLGYPGTERRTHLLSEFLEAAPVPARVSSNELESLVAELDGFSPADMRAIVGRATGYARHAHADDDTGADPRITPSTLEKAMGTLSRDLVFDSEPESDFLGDAEYDTVYQYDDHLTVDIEDEDDDPVEFTLFDDDEDDQPHVAIQKLDSVPEVTYDDVGGLAEAKRMLREAVEWPREHPELCDNLGIDTAKGILLHGPPGNGKTLLAKAIANETESRFISVKGPEVLDKYVGEAQRFVDTLFDTARELSPAVIFIDEIDSITDQRGGTGSERVTDSIVNQLLLELDGLDELSDIVVVGATNRPELIDDALTRPGRLGETIFVPPPDRDAQREIFAVHTGDRPVAADVDLNWLVEATPDAISGAEIAAVCETASQAALRRTLEADDASTTPDSADIQITRQDFECALADGAGEAPDAPGFH